MDSHSIPDHRPCWLKNATLCDGISARRRGQAVAFEASSQEVN